MLIDFIYIGEVNVMQEDLEAFLTAAIDLKIQGLTPVRLCTPQKICDMNNILDKKDSKGKVGGRRKEQKRNFKDNKFGFDGKKRNVKKMTSGAQMMSPANVRIKRQDQKAKERGVLGARQDLGKRQKLKNR